MRQGFRSGMMLPRVQRIKRNGRVLSYHRPTRTRLPDLPETHPDFIAAWAAAEAGTERTSAAPGTLAHAIEATKRSKTFTAFSPVYARMMRVEFDAMSTAYGHVRPGGIKQKHIEADLSKLETNAANKRLKAWRVILAQAKIMGLVEADPSFGLRKRRVDSDGHTAWSGEEIARFRKHWPIGTIQRGCFELLFWTGARVSDAVRLSRSHVGGDGVLSFRQAKTKGPAHVPWSCPLPAWARGWSGEQAAVRESVEAVAPSGFTFLETSTGKARSAKGLSNTLTAAARAAGIEGRTAHGLRKARLTAIADAGGSTQAIMSWGGHKSLSEAEHYTRSANRKQAVLGTEQDQNAGNGPVNEKSSA